MLRRASLLGGVAALAVSMGLVGPAAEAQTHPGCIEGPLTIMVPRSAGGGLDLLARLVGPEWGKALGVDVIVENNGGGGGAIGLAEAYRAAADGTTVVSWSPPGEFMLQVQELLPFTVDEWEMIGATNSDPILVAVPPNSRFETFQQLVEASTTGGERLTASLVGRTSTDVPDFALFTRELGVNWALVPFDGGGEQTTALMGGHTDLGLRNGGLYNLHPNEIRILAVGNAERIAELPDVPTVLEATGKEVLWGATRGFAVRKGTPPEILECLRAAFNEAAQSPAIVDHQYEAIGFRYEFLDAAALDERSRMQSQIAAEFLE